MRRGAERKGVQEQGLVVSFPAIGEKARLRPPSVGKGRAPVQRPGPVDSAVESVGDLPDLRFLFVLTGEVLGSGKRSGNQESRVNCRQLAVPDTAARLHIQ